MTAHNRIVSSSFRALALLMMVSIASTAVSSEGEPLFRFVQKAGPHQVGLKVIEQYDYSRTYRRSTDALGKPYQGERARPLQTLVWYPAEHAKGKPMTVGDYGGLLATETSFGKPGMSAHAKDWLSAMSPTLKTSLWAVRDAPAATGRFPVLIYAPSYSAMSWENADLCEYLASHGYVVIASPDMGARTRGMTGDVAGIEAQAEDISFLIGYAQSLANTDMSAVAVAGFSWGGISNLFAAARDSRIDALVALDGSMRYYPDLVKQAGYVHPEQMTIPLLYFSQGELSIEEQAKFFSPAQLSTPNVLNAWTHGDLITAHMLGFMHVEFSSMYQRNENTWKSYDSNRKADYKREDGITGYALVARYTLAFLDAYLKHEATATSYLKRTPAENGAPEHFMTVSYRAASGTPASFDGLRSELGRRGFDHITDIYSQLQKEKPDFKPEETSLEFWSSELLDGHHFPEGIAVLKLDTQIYPDSGEAYASLGNAYALAGQKPLAIESYKLSLQKEPDSQQVKEKLKALEAKP